MLKDLIERHFEVLAPPSRNEYELSLNIYEVNALWYAAGYVPRALTKN